MAPGECLPKENMEVEIGIPSPAGIFTRRTTCAYVVIASGFTNKRPIP
jgi:hypothetical protein